MYNFVLNASRCTSNCVFCFGRDFGDIQSNIHRELRKLSEILSRGEEIPELEISGNDPAEYPRLPELVGIIRRAIGDCSVSVLSHGRTLKDTQFADALILAGVNKFVIPLYGADAATHDAVTRTPGSFRDTVSALDVLGERGAQIRITSLIMSENQHRIFELLNFVSVYDGEPVIGFPHFAGREFREHAADFSTIRRQLSEALLKVLRTRDVKPWLRDIPYCMLTFPYPFIEHSEAPRFGYEHLTAEMGGLHSPEYAPLYRSFSKMPQCGECVFDSQCRGFYRTYLDGGLCRLDPIRA